MVKFGKNRFKALNKIVKKQNLSHNGSNKILKKKLNAQKKVHFQTEVLKDIATEGSPLVKKVSAQEVVLKKSSRKSVRINTKEEVIKPKKIKSVEKRKKRQKTQLNDKNLLLSLMKKK